MQLGSHIPLISGAEKHTTGKVIVTDIGDGSDDFEHHVGLADELAAAEGVVNPVQVHRQSAKQLAIPQVTAEASTLVASDAGMGAQDVLSGNGHRDTQAEEGAGATAFLHFQKSPPVDEQLGGVPKETRVPLPSAGPAVHQSSVVAAHPIEVAAEMLGGMKPAQSDTQVQIPIEAQVSAWKQPAKGAGLINVSMAVQANQLRGATPVAMADQPVDFKPQSEHLTSPLYQSPGGESVEVGGRFAGEHEPKKPSPPQPVLADKSQPAARSIHWAGHGDAPSEIKSSPRVSFEAEGVEEAAGQQTQNSPALKPGSHMTATMMTSATSSDLSLPSHLPADENFSAPDPISEIAVTEVRAAESLTARAEISGHLRTELPRHIAVQLAEVARLQPDRPVELTLNPEELGRLRLTFSGDLSAMTVSVNVERPETLDLMRRHIDLLAQEMRDVGYDEISFSFEQFGSGEGGSSEESRSPTRVLSGDELPDDVPAPSTTSPLRLTVSGRTGIDIRL